jgi:hypothetical protein
MKKTNTSKIMKKQLLITSLVIVALSTASAMAKRAREDAADLGMGGASDGEGEGISADERIYRDIERTYTMLDGCV